MVHTNDHQPTKKKSKGKQKIEIKKIDYKPSRQVTYTKRRKGLVRKCSELCSSNPGSQFAVITFSISGRIFYDGYPNAEAVIHRFIVDSWRNIDESETLKMEGTSSLITNGSNNPWWENSMDNMGLEELEMFKTALHGLKTEVVSGVIEQISRSSDAERIDRGCTDAIDGLHLSELSEEITDSINLKEPQKFKIAQDGLKNDVVSRVGQISPSDDTEMIDLGCTCTAANEGLHLSDLSEEITEIIKIKEPPKFKISQEGLKNEVISRVDQISHSSNTEIVVLGCTDATNDVHLSDFSKEITDSFNVEESYKFKNALEGFGKKVISRFDHIYRSKEAEIADLGCIHASYGGQHSDLSKKITENINSKQPQKLKSAPEGLRKEIISRHDQINRSKDTEIVHLICADDAINGVHHRDSSHVTSETINLESNDANLDVQVSELCQRKNKGFDLNEPYDLNEDFDLND